MFLFVYTDTVNRYVVIGELLEILLGLFWTAEPGWLFPPLSVMIN